MLGAANLIPGPTSTEMAINVGFIRAAWAGLCVAGASFILPAALITAAFAWAYVRFGSLPLAISVLMGIKPSVVAVIAIAIWHLAKTAVKDTGLGARLASRIRLHPDPGPVGEGGIATDGTTSAQLNLTI